MSRSRPPHRSELRGGVSGSVHTGSGNIYNTLAPEPIPTIPNKGSNLPHRLANFVGREEDITRVLSALASRAWIVTIDGIGGIGKTTLALEVALRCLERSVEGKNVPAFTGFVWTSARGKPDYGLNDLIHEIVYTLAPHEAKKLDSAAALGLARRVLSFEPRLVIIDNFETIKDEEVHRFLRDGLPEPSKVLITSRHHLQEGEKVVTLGGLSVPEAIQLLKSETERWGIVIAPEEEPELGWIAEKSYGIPFVLKWVLENVHTGKPLEWVVETLENATADDIFNYIFSRSLSELDEKTRHLFHVMAAFKAPVHIEAIRALAPHRAALPDRLGKLTRLSLLETNQRLHEAQKLYWLHPFTRYLAERELANMPEMQVQLKAALANYFILDTPKRSVSILDDCAQLQTEGDNYIEGIAWLHNIVRPGDIEVWDRADQILRAIQECGVALDGSKLAIVDATRVAIEYTRYLRFLLERTRYSQRYAPWLISHDDSVAGNLLDAAMPRLRPSTGIVRKLTVKNESEEAIEISQLLCERRRSVLLGQPGSGKTTLLNYLVQLFVSDSEPVQALVKRMTQERHDNLMPILLLLRGFSRYDVHREGYRKEQFGNIMEGIVQQLEPFHFSGSVSFLENKLNDGQAILLLDGLDEVEPRLRERISEEIETFSRRYPECWIIVTSRPAKLERVLSSFDQFEMQAFDEEQIIEIVAKQLGPQGKPFQSHLRSQLIFDLGTIPSPKLGQSLERGSLIVFDSVLAGAN